MVREEQWYMYAALVFQDQSYQIYSIYIILIMCKENLFLTELETIIKGHQAKIGEQTIQGSQD